MEKQATGFLAVRVDGETQRVFGIAIPDGAFVEVPGQGFERIGDSYKAGPERLARQRCPTTSRCRSTTTSVVDDAVYKAMLKDQDVARRSSPAATDDEPRQGRARRARRDARRRCRARTSDSRRCRSSPITIGSVDVLRAAARRDRRPAVLVVGREGRRRGSRRRASSSTTARARRASPAWPRSSSSRRASASWTPATPTSSTTRRRRSCCSAASRRMATRVRDILGVGEVVEQAGRPGHRRRHRHHRQGLHAAGAVGARAIRTEEGSNWTSSDYAMLAAEAAADKKATDIVVLDVAELLVITDYFVIATGNTDRQVKVIADEIEDAAAKEAGLQADRPRGRARGAVDPARLRRPRRARVPARRSASSTGSRSCGPTRRASSCPRASPGRGGRRRPERGRRGS